MKMRLAAGGALAALMLLVAGVAGALDGDPPAASGWWTSQPGAAAEPDGGFQVGAVGGQPVSIAAVRFSTPSGVTSATLSLQESGGFVTPASSLQVCPTSDPWEPANPGALDAAPEADCTNPIALTRDAAALVWTAEVGPLLPSLGGEPTLMIVPGVEAGGGSPLDPGFSVTFSGAALAVVSAPGTTTTTFSSFAPPPSSSGGSTSPSFGGSSSGSVSGIGPVAPTTVPAAPPTTVASSSGGEAFAPPALAAGATPGGDGANQPWARLLFLLPLSAMIGVGSVYGKRLLQQRGVLEEA